MLMKRSLNGCATGLLVLVMVLAFGATALGHQHLQVIFEHNFETEIEEPLTISVPEWTLHTDEGVLISSGQHEDRLGLDMSFDRSQEPILEYRIYVESLGQYSTLAIWMFRPDLPRRQIELNMPTHYLQPGVRYAEGNAEIAYNGDAVIEAGNWYDIRVVYGMPTIEIFINGELALAVDDEDLESFTFGFYSWSSVIEIDHIRILAATE